MSNQLLNFFSDCPGTISFCYLLRLSLPDRNVTDQKREILSKICEIGIDVLI